MKIIKSITFNGCSVCLFNQNKSVFALCDVLLKLEGTDRKCLAVHRSGYKLL